MPDLSKLRDVLHTVIGYLPFREEQALLDAHGAVDEAFDGDSADSNADSNADSSAKRPAGVSNPDGSPFHQSATPPADSGKNDQD